MCRGTSCTSSPGGSNFARSMVPMGGSDLDAVNTFLKVHAARVKLLGLAAPAQLEVSAAKKTTELLDDYRTALLTGLHERESSEATPRRERNRRHEPRIDVGRDVGSRAGGVDGGAAAAGG